MPNGATLDDEVTRNRIAEALSHLDTGAGDVPAYLSDLDTEPTQPAPSIDDYLDTSKSIDPGVDVGFGPGAAPPDISQTQEQQRQMPTPAVPEAPIQLPAITVEGQAEQPAPDTLTQVERAELVKEPDYTPSGSLVTPETPPAPTPQVQPAPDTLSQVERAQLVPQDTSKIVGPPPPGAPAPTAPTAFPAVQPPTAPAVQPAQPVSGAPQVPAVTAPQAKTGAPSIDDYLDTGAPKAVTAAPVPDVSSYVNPNGSELPARIQAVGNQDPAAFIAHHTGGRGTMQSVIDTLHERGLGVEYIMDRDGNIYDAGFGAGASNILPGWGPKGDGLNNRNVVGMEVIAKDDKDVTEAQKQSFARFIAARYPTTPVFGHGEVNPGHKEADEGASTSSAALALRAQLASGGATAGAEQPPAGQPGAPRARPAGQNAQGFYADENPKDFVQGSATAFATPEDKANFAQGKAAGLTDKEALAIGDNGVGAPKLGGLNTSDAYGVAIPLNAAIAQLGNNPKAWRTARVDIIDATTGQRMRVPLVDFGISPSQQDKGVAIDMTPGLDKLFNNQGGNGHQYYVKLVPNAGPDVLKEPDAFADEQAAIRQGTDLGAVSKSRQIVADSAASGFLGRPMSPAESVAADQARQFALSGQQDNLRILAENTPNDIALLNRLDQPVDGVSPQMQQKFQANLKAQITSEAQKYYGISDPDQAFAKATSPSNIGDFAQAVGKSAMGVIGQTDIGINQFFKDTDSALVNNFLNTVGVVHPGLIPEGKNIFLQHLATLSQTERSQKLGDLMKSLPPTIQGSMDIVGIADAADRLSDPKYQAAQNQAIQQKQNWLEQNANVDPNFKGTPAEWWAGNLGSLGANVILGSVSAPARASLFYAQLYGSAKDDIAKQHPDWSDDQVSRQASLSAAVQLAPQETLLAAIHGKFGGLTEGIKGPITRGAATALANTALGAGATGVQQATANIMAGKPWNEGLPQAVASGALQAGIPGVLHGAITAREAPPEERAAVAPEARPEAPAEPVTPAEPARRPVTGAEVLGPEPQPEPGFKSVPETVPWQTPGPIVTRAEPRTAFAPQELQQAIDQLRQGGSPEQIAEAVRNLQPEPSFTRQNVYLQDQPYEPVETLPPLRDPAQPAEAAPSVTAARPAETAAAVVSPAETPPPVTAERPTVASVTPVPEAQGTDKWVSSIANRFVQPRVEANEIGEIAPGQGYSTQELINAGLKMSPEEVTQHMSDLMQGVGNSKAQAAAIRAEEARLSQRSAQASQIAEANPGNAQARIQADNAFNDLTDFHNGPVAKLKSNWHASGMAMQGEIPVDLSTYNGLREAWLRDTGNAPPPGAEPALRRTAARVKAANDAEAAAMGKLGDVVEKSAKAKLTDSQVRDNIMKRMGIGPCIVP